MTENIRIGRGCDRRETGGALKTGEYAADESTLFQISQSQDRGSTPERHR